MKSLFDLVKANVQLTQRYRESQNVVVGHPGLSGHALQPVVCSLSLCASPFSSFLHVSFTLGGIWMERGMMCIIQDNVRVSVFVPHRKLRGMPLQRSPYGSCIP